MTDEVTSPNPNRHRNIYPNISRHAALKNRQRELFIASLDAAYILFRADSLNVGIVFDWCILIRGVL
jgi:hypothetical protein